MIQINWIFDENGRGTCQQSEEITLNGGMVVQFEIEGTCRSWNDSGSYESEPSSGITDEQIEITITAVYNAEGWELTEYDENKLIKKINEEIEI
jgi:hypothetical protein